MLPLCLRSREAFRGMYIHLLELEGCGGLVSDSCHESLTTPGVASWVVGEGLDGDLGLEVRRTTSFLLIIWTKFIGICLNFLKW